jgi:hypothetical protein
VKRSLYEVQTINAKDHYLIWISKGDFISVCSDKLLKSIREERVEGIVTVLLLFSAFPMKRECVNFKTCFTEGGK